MDTNILKKLQESRKIIKESKLKKAGHNDYSNYDYYTPDQIAFLVDDATNKTSTIVLTDFKTDEFGLFQELIFVDIEKPDSFLLFHFRTKHGALTASNETQEMGGTDTYSDRYIKMKVFDIKDNTLDPDSQDQRKPKEKMITQDQRDWFAKSITALPVNEAGKLNHWLKSEHSFKEAEKFQTRINTIVDELSNR